MQALYAKNASAGQETKAPWLGQPAGRRQAGPLGALSALGMLGALPPG